MKNRIMVLVMAGLLIGMAGSALSQMTSTSFKIFGSNLNGGGNVPTQTDGGAGSFILGTSLGQSTPIGESTDLTGTLFTNGAGFWYQLAALTEDTDNDGAPNIVDNCILEPNGPDIPDAGGNVQLDTDMDGYGNLCDTDLNNSSPTNFLDLGLFKTVFMTADLHADFNGDGIVNFLDLGIMKKYFMQPPGPSGLVP